MGNTQPEQQVSIQIQTALQTLRHYGWQCVPYGDQKILVRDGADLVVVPVHRVDQFLKGVK